MIPVALSIAGSDPSGGAGIQADLKTFHQFGVYGQAVITLLTVQNTVKVSRVDCLDPALVREQLEAVLEDMPAQAAKTGALGNAAIIETVAQVWSRHPMIPLIVDPVMISKHGASLIAEDARDALVQQLLPRAALVTPNLHEASLIAGFTVDSIDAMKRAAERILSFGCKAVLVKGGHLVGSATDVLLSSKGFLILEAERTDTNHTHGTGCTYSAAITAGLAGGQELEHAVRAAKWFIAEAIRTNPGLGHGSGPVNHHATIKQKD